jgi:hypothetical protein
MPLLLSLSSSTNPPAILAAVDVVEAAARYRKRAWACRVVGSPGNCRVVAAGSVANASAYGRAIVNGSIINRPARKTLDHSES